MDTRGEAGRRGGKFVVGITEPGYADQEVEKRLLEPLGAEVRYLRWGGDRARLLEM